MENNVLVLMSSYNGQKYIKEQIDCILAQKGVNVKLIVRDDGSTDGTLQILKDYADKNLLEYYTGGNLGPQRSFMHLLKNAPQSDYYAFADQDDFWMDDKLATAVNMLGSSVEQPSLYFSRTMLADSSLNPLGSVEVSPLLTFGESLVYEFATGCTMVLNDRLRTVINAYTPEYLAMHDVWVYSVALAVGATVKFDKVPHMFYRQHGNNVVGQGQGWMHDMKKRVGRIMRSENSRYRRAKEIVNGFSGMMPDSNRCLAENFVNAKTSFVQRVKLCFDKRLACSNSKTSKLFRLALLFNTY